MTTSKLNWRIPLVAWAPISLAIVAETVSNALRAYGLGSHLEQFSVTAYGHTVSLSGSVMVLAAVAVSLTQACAAWKALTPGPWKQRIVASLAAVLLLAISITAMSSHILEAQRAKVADEGGARGAYDRAERAYKAAQAELDSLQNVRPVAAIQADVSAFKIDADLWRRSKQCQEATKPDTQAYCDPLLSLYKERGLAARKTELEPKVATLRDDLAKMSKPEVATTSELEVAGYWAWLMGFGVVFVATFGTVLFAKVTPVAIDPKWTAQTSFPTNDGLGGLTALLDGTPPTLPPTNTFEPEYKGTDVIDWAEQFFKRHGRAPRGIEAETAFAKQIEAKEISRSTVLRRNDAFRASVMASA